MSSQLILRLVVLLVGLVLAGYVISRFTQGLIRWIVLAALGIIAAVALRLAFQQFPISLPNLTASPNAQPTTVPNTGQPTQTAPAPATSPLPSAPVTQSPAAQPAEQSPDTTPDQGQTGFRDLPSFAQPFSPTGGSANSGTTSGGTSGSTSQPQPSRPSSQSAQRPRPITGGW